MMLHKSDQGVPPPAEAARQAPHSLEAEQALLGAIIISNSTLERVSGIIASTHFFDPLHAHLFDLFLKLSGAGRPITMTIVKPLVEDLPPLNETMTVPQYLGRLVANATSSALLWITRRRSSNWPIAGR